MRKETICPKTGMPNHSCCPDYIVLLCLAERAWRSYVVSPERKPNVEKLKEDCLLERARLRLRPRLRFFSLRASTVLEVGRHLFGVGGIK